MELGTVMQEIADQLATIDGLEVFAYPPRNAPPPCAVVSYPDDYSFDSAYQRGQDTITLPVVIVVGKVTDLPARDQITGYVSGSGASSIKAILESGTYDSIGTVHVRSVSFDVAEIGTTGHLTATFQVDITGKGGA